MNLKTDQSLCFFNIIFLIFFFTSCDSLTIETKEKTELSEAVQFRVSHKSGFYKKPFKLSIDHPAELKIYYTTDGSFPDTNSTLYMFPIDLKPLLDAPGHLSMVPTTPLEGMWNLKYFKWIEPKIKMQKTAAMIRIREFENGVATAGYDAITFVYFIENETTGKHQFPIISIVTEEKHLFDYEKGIYIPGVHYENASWQNSNDPFWPPGNYLKRGKRWERPAAIHYFDKKKKLGFSINAGICIQGAVTGGFPIKSLRILMKKKFGDSILHYPVFEDSEHSTFKRLLLRTSGNDFLGTYFRDALLQEVLSPLDLELQASTPSVVYINGEYWGIHNIREKLDKHYIKTHFKLKDEQFDILEECGSLNHGSVTEFKTLMNHIINNDIRDLKVYKHVCKNIDINNYIDQHLAELYFGNSDWPANNVKLWKEKGPGNKWRWLTFDLDLSLGYSKMGNSHSPDHNSLKYGIEEGSEKWFNYGCSTFLLRTLLKNKRFKTSFIERYIKLSKSVFSADNIIKKIDQYELLYESEMKMHIDRWNYPTSMVSWREEINRMRDYVRQRPKYFKDHLEMILNVKINDFSK
jgi:hypothetical protein|tara:strand:- start:216 stop:1949 length:1734 start_codon:yes stop_codon:yes gene_type:complete